MWHQRTSQLIFDEEKREQQQHSEAHLNGFVDLLLQAEIWTDALSLAPAPLSLSLPSVLREWFNPESRDIPCVMVMDLWNETCVNFNYRTLLWGCEQAVCFAAGSLWAQWVSFFSTSSEHLLLLAFLWPWFDRSQLKASRGTHRGVQLWKGKQKLALIMWDDLWDLMDLGCRQPEKKRKGKGCSALYFGHMQSCGIFPHRTNAIDAQQPP